MPENQTVSAPHSAPSAPPPHTGAVRIAFLISGAVSLIYQVLWMRELGLLFGNTAQASATTISAFFLGLAVGGWAAGARSSRLSNPLRAYGWVEIGIALAALLFFGLMHLYGLVYPPLFRRLGHAPEVFLLIKFVLGVLVLLPASALIGATLPLVGEYLLLDRDSLGRQGTVLYALNTVGAVVGTYLAGFVLPLAVGFRVTYGLAVIANLVIGVAMLAVAAGSRRAVAPEPAPSPLPPRPEGLSWNRVLALGFLSGLVTLALEVLWTRMFAQVLHNSVYTFAIILITFLAALAAGSFFAHRLIVSGPAPGVTLTRLLGGGAVLVAVSPWLFFALTGGLRYVADQSSWVGYQLVVFTLAAVVILPATLLLGTVFPYLMKLAEAHSKSAGHALGRLVAVNTLGGIAGSLLAGFLLLSWIGLWSSLRLAALLALAGLPWAVRDAGERGAAMKMAVAGLILVGLVGLARPPIVRLDPDQDERLVDLREGSAGAVAVVRNHAGLVIKVNNHYTLGGSASAEDERRQGALPLLLHPQPREVYYLGMGTGITASAGLVPGVERVTVCELVPDVILMARRHFAPFTGALFSDPRVRILAEDGRTFLRSTDERFDVIVSDLFVPWEARAGSLYSLEHFRAARARLKPGGLLAQWLPLYQLSQREFDIIARTMLEVFPEITVWRGDLSVANPTVALIGRVGAAPLDPEVVTRRLREVPDPHLVVDQGRGAGRLLWGYAGNLTVARARVAGAPLNTDDRPLIEYLAPVTHRQIGRGTSFLTHLSLAGFYLGLIEASPPETDPYLARLPAAERGFARAGYYLHRSSLLRRGGRAAAADSADVHLRDLLIRIYSQPASS